MPANAWQVKYKTLDNQGAPTATVTTVMVPTKAWTGTGPRPLVSYQVAEDGVGGKCSASYALSAGIEPGGQESGNAQGETAIMRQALDRGWAVASPDYEGPRSAFIGADIEGRETLDGIRAALRFAPAGLGAGTPVGMWGYSGGSLASALAAQLQPTYAPDLKLSGIALGGLVPDVKATFDAFDKIGGGAAAGLVGIIGLDRAYPSEHLLQYLNAKGRQAVAENQRACLGDTVVRYAGHKASEYATLPPSFATFLRSVSPISRPGTPSAPVYDYHGTQDELAPIGPDREQMARYCGDGVAVQHVELPGEHFSEVAAGADGAMSFLADRFAGLRAPSTCPAPKPGAGATQAATYGAYPYLVHTPSSYRPGHKMPLLVMVHGCQTTAEQQMRANLYNELAEREGFVVLYPDVDATGALQPGPTNQCWRFPSPASWTRGHGDAAALAGMTRAVMKRWHIDTQRVYMMGMSAGSFMTAIMAAAYPDIYAAVGEMAGGAYADPECLFGNPATTPVQVSAKAAYTEMGSRARVIPRLVMGGDADQAVAPACADKALMQGLRTDNLVIDGTQTAPIKLTPASVVDRPKPGGYAYTIRTYRDPAGCVIGERWVVHGMNHFWSGGSSDPQLASWTDPKGPSGAEASWRFFSRFREGKTEMPCAER
jgi:poly(hydroxyalkanoate) depolymerase family esterase